MRRGFPAGILEHPETHPYCVYRFYDCDGRLLYAGATRSLELRIAQHGHTGKAWFCDVDRMRTRVAWFETVAEARDAENAAIAGELPVHNRIGKPGQRRSSYSPAPHSGFFKGLTREQVKEWVQQYDDADPSEERGTVEWARKYRGYKG